MPRLQPAAHEPKGRRKLGRRLLGRRMEFGNAELTPLTLQIQQAADLPPRLLSRGSPPFTLPAALDQYLTGF